MGAVRDAVLVAAGLGTRMFPSSAYIAKETLPLIDIPLLSHLVLEAKAAGIERLHIVISPNKSFEGMFEDRRELHALRSHLDATLFNIADGLTIHTHIQHQAKGVGDAILCALDDIEGPFLVMLGDNLLMDTHSPSSGYMPTMASHRLITAHADRSGATVALMEVRAEEVQAYGVVGLHGDIITDIVEKPHPSQAPSRFVLCGRYVFPSTTKALLEQLPWEQYGELQSIALQKQLMAQGMLRGYVLENTQWYDSGSPEKWLQAQVDHALRRPDLAPLFSSWLKQRLDD